MIKSYRDLAKVGKRLDVYSSTDRERTIIGLFCLGKSLDQIDEFKTNRYFQEALNIKEMPKEDLAGDDVMRKDMAGEAKCLIAEITAGKNIFIHSIDKEKLDRDGYLVIPNVLPNDVVSDLRKLVIYNSEHERKNNTAYLYGINCQRIYNLIGKSEALGMTIAHPIISEIMDYMFDRPTLHDKYYLSSWHANIIGQGAAAGMLHLDAAVPAPIPPWIIRSNICFMLDDFTEENGATLCLPGSHKFCEIPSRYIEDEELTPMIGKAGSLAIWHGHLWHKSGSNNTNKERIGLLGCFVNSVLREMSLEENHFRIIEDMESLSDDLKVLIGYDHGIKKGAMWK